MTEEIVKGFRDIEDCSRRILMRKIIENVFQSYNFIPVETPIIEYESFVKKGNENSETISDIFKLKDKGKRDLALRYEFTFQLKRLAKNKKLPYRRYQIGEVFRDEPTCKNRWRQFIQCDADIVGAGIREEAEILKITSEILEKLKIDFTILFNNRKLLNEILEELKIPASQKPAVIKEIDKLDKLTEKEVKENLKRFNAEKIFSYFKKPESYFERFESYKEIQELKRFCSLYKTKIKFVPYLARGLSYYNGSIFEIKSKIKETIAAGGSYLTNNIQSTGISFGLDRLELITRIKDEKNRFLIISLNQDEKAIEIAEKIRKTNPVQIFYGKPSKALDYANSYKIKYVVFIGEEEIKKEKLKIRNMDSGKEKLIEEKNLEKEIRSLKRL